MAFSKFHHVEVVLEESRLRGFTLIEMMVTIAIMVILLTIAVPSFNDATLGSKLGSYANNLIASAYLARSEAMKRNITIKLCASSDGTNCATSGGWAQGWIVKSGAMVFKHQAALPTGLTIIQTSAGTAIHSLDFKPIGVGTTPITLKFCRASPVGNQERVVNINTTGGASVKRTSSGCP